MEVGFLMTIEGTTTDGEEFSVDAEAVKLSTCGTTLITDVAVEAGTRVLIRAPFGGEFEGEVNGVWIDGGDGKQHIGVKLLGDAKWFGEEV